MKPKTFIKTCPICGNDSNFTNRYKKYKCPFCKSYLLLIEKKKGSKTYLELVEEGNK